MKGCLIWIVIFAALTYVEAMWIQALGLPHAWGAAVQLAFLATLALGSVQGLLQLGRNSAVSRTPIDLLADGAVIRLSGILRARRQALTTPVTHRAAVIYQYEMRAQRLAGTKHDRRREGAVGMDMAECVIDTPQGRIALNGFPSLRDIPEQKFSEASHRQAMAQLLASTTWRMRGLASAGIDFQGILAMAKGDMGELPLHMINPRTLDRVRLPTEQNREVEVDMAAIEKMVDDGKWIYAERVIAEGVPVTVTGTYQKLSRCIHIGTSFNLEAAPHGIKLGTAKAVAAAELRAALAMALIIFLVTALAHYLVFGNESHYYGLIVEKIREIRGL
jgi:hypothetical protein